MKLPYRWIFALLDVNIFFEPEQDIILKDNLFSETLLMMPTFLAGLLWYLKTTL